MPETRIEILKLVAEGKISPEEAERLLDALGDSGAQRRGGPESSGPGGEESRAGRLSEGIAQVLEEVGDTVRRAVEDAVSAAGRVFEEHRPATESVGIQEGTCSVPRGSRLKVQQAVRVSFGGGSRGGNVILRTVSGDRLRIVRGEAVEVHRHGTDHVLTWAKGTLELEIPDSLSALEVRCMGGDVEVIDFPGPMSLETMGGELRARSPRAPFRFRTLGGRVRIAGLDLQEGSATVSSTGGDVHLELAAGASMTIRASTLGGMIEFPEGTEQETQGRARRRAVCVIGSGAAELKINTLGGDVHVRLAA